MPENLSASSAVDQQPAGHSFSIAATGLPPDLTIDPGIGLISGSGRRQCRHRLPYHVSVSSLTHTHTASSSFQWTVLPGVPCARRESSSHIGAPGQPRIQARAFSVNR